MIFTTGSQTYQPHQIGIKLMSKVKFRTKLNIPENIFEAAEEGRRKREEERESRLGRINFEPTPWSDYRQVAQMFTPWSDYRQVAQMFDIVDVLIDFHGFVTGYGVSPDSRFYLSLFLKKGRENLFMPSRREFFIVNKIRQF